MTGLQTVADGPVLIANQHLPTMGAWTNIGDDMSQAAIVVVATVSATVEAEHHILVTTASAHLGSPDLSDT
jgi:hypothetical protein